MPFLKSPCFLEKECLGYSHLSYNFYHIIIRARILVMLQQKNFLKQRTRVFLSFFLLLAQGYVY